MSDEEKGNFLTDLVNSIKVPADITKHALEPASKQIGEGLGDLFYLAFSPIAKARFKKEHEIKLFKEEIEAQIAKVPADQLVEPPLNIVGPALEASKYYIEYEDMRNMFAKLIASSMNEDERNKAHTAFVEIIKQFSPLDAKNIKFLADNLHVAVGKIRIQSNDGSGGGTDWIDNLFPFPNSNFENYETFSASLDNLIRLGLLKISWFDPYTDLSKYETLEAGSVYKHCLVVLESHNKQHPDSPKAIELTKGSWTITDFGKLFTHCCL